MKLLFSFLIFLSANHASAKPEVLISYFDAFGTATFNNSEVIAKALLARFDSPSSPLTVKLCPLTTVFDKAYAQSEECLKAQSQSPVFVLALGESFCQLKIETMVGNLDRTSGADNAGNHRDNTVIISEAPRFLGLRYPLPQMYCALSEQEKQNINLSNDAGKFVCNNTAYQMSYYHPELQYGFIHVPASHCTGLESKTQTSIEMLEKMIVKAVSFLTESKVDEGLPHALNDVRLPTTKKEVRILRRQYADGDLCLRQYLERTQGRKKK